MQLFDCRSIWALTLSLMAPKDSSECCRSLFACHCSLHHISIGLRGLLPLQSKHARETLDMEPLRGDHQVVFPPAAALVPGRCPRLCIFPASTQGAQRISDTEEISVVIVLREREPGSSAAPSTQPQSVSSVTAELTTSYTCGGENCSFAGIHQSFSNVLY